jgi:hypothetical protein
LTSAIPVKFATPANSRTLSLCTGRSLTNCQPVTLPHINCINLSSNFKVNSMTIPKLTQCQVYDYANCDIFDQEKSQGRSAYVNVPGQQNNKRMFDMKAWGGHIASLRCFTATTEKAGNYVS